MRPGVVPDGFHLTLFRVGFGEPAEMHPDVAAMLRKSLEAAGNKGVRYVTTEAAQRMNKRHFDRLHEKWGR